MDKIADKDTIVGFLKELYRFQNLLTNKQKRNIIFIVSLKPEALLKESNKPRKNDYENHTFDKIFDYTINLKPLHFEDYGAVILNILNNKKNKDNGANKANLEKILGYTISDKLSADFEWILKGNNLTIRNLKDRLNQAISLMVTLYNKNYKLPSKASISFRTCAAVTYLEHTYSAEYYDLIKSETELAEAIRNSYSVRNSENSQEQKTNMISNLLTFIEKESTDDNLPKSTLLSDLATQILEGTIDDDFRMYLYNYPKGIRIKTSDEKDLSNLLLLPGEYLEDKQLNEKVDRIISINREDNIIVECLNQIKGKDSINAFPTIITFNEYLFKTAMQIDMRKTNNVVLLNTMWDTLLKISIETLERIGAFSKEIRHSFFPKYCFALVDRFKNYESNLKIKIRSEIIRICEEDILIFSSLFIPIHGDMLSDDQDFPIISDVEISSINDISNALALINIEKIDEDNIKYLASRINNKQLDELCYKQADKFYLSFYTKLDQEVVAPLLLDFLLINKAINLTLFEHIADWLYDVYNDKRDEVNKFNDYINSLDIVKIPNEYLVIIDSMCLYRGLNDSILHTLKKNKLFLTYLCSMYMSDRLEEIDFNSNDTCDLILKACIEIRAFDEDLIYELELCQFARHKSSYF